MLTLWGTKPNRFCDDLSRRDFLHIGGLGFAGITLADLIRLKAQGAAKQRAGAKSVIMIFLRGGPSHIDMYDMKPEAPVEYRGEFNPIRTNVPGFDICEFMPQQAKIADKMAVIRNMKFAQDPGHLAFELTTGLPWKDRPLGRPSIGSIVSRLWGPNSGLPRYVAIGEHPRFDEYGSGFLGPAHRALEPFGQVGEDLRPARGLTADRLRSRRELLGAFDTLRRDLDVEARLEAADSSTKQALEMIASDKVRDALDIDREPEAVRRRYNAEPAGSKGPLLQRNLLLARRLVEAGVAVVCLTYLSDPVFIFPQPSWDTHTKNFPTMRALLPRYDHGIAALISDLHERGLDKDVAVVIWGDMGRAPKVERVGGGRGHWPEAGFALVAGGGFKTGQVIGATDSHAAKPKTAPYTPRNVLATLYQHLGIDPATTLPDHTGRPQYLLDDREPVKELL